MLKKVKACHGLGQCTARAKLAVNNIWNKNDRHTWLAMDILVAPYIPGNSADLAKSESALTGFVIIE